MTGNPDLKKIERDAYCTSNVHDGLFDIMLGLVLLVPALLSILQVSENYMLPVYGILLVLFTIARRKITVPRVGHVRFGAERKKKLQIVSAVLAASVAVLFVIMKNGRETVIGGKVPLNIIIVAAVIMLVFSFMAYFINYRRFHLYGVLLGISIPLSRLLELYGILRDRSVVNVSVSAVILLTGLITFIRFLRSYRPLSDGEL